MRITARLVRTANETQLWAETYERPLVDCLGVQTEVAARIARSLAVELVAGAPTPRVRAGSVASFSRCPPACRWPSA